MWSNSTPSDHIGSPHLATTCQFVARGNGDRVEGIGGDGLEPEHVAGGRPRGRGPQGARTDHEGGRAEGDAGAEKAATRDLPLDQSAEIGLHGARMADFVELLARELGFRRVSGPGHPWFSSCRDRRGDVFCADGSLQPQPRERRGPRKHPVRNRRMPIRAGRNELTAALRACGSIARVGPPSFASSRDRPKPAGGQVRNYSACRASGHEEATIPARALRVVRRGVS